MSTELFAVNKIKSEGNGPTLKRYVEVSAVNKYLCVECQKKELTEKEAETGYCEECWIRELLRQEAAEQEVSNYKENKINWMTRDFWDSWDKIKGHYKKIVGAKKEYTDSKQKWFFLAHDKDTLVGKPQLISGVQKKIPLIRLAVNSQEEYETDSEGKRILNDKGKPKKTGRTLDIKSFYFFDEAFDKRHDGFLKESFALDFWVYKIVTKECKEVFIWTQQKLPNCTCTFKGMMVELDDFTEMSRSLKIKCISNIFFVKEFVPSVKLLTKEQLITFTKEREITEENWLDFLASHPLGTMNRFPKDTEMLKSAWLLSGKFDGYPLHLFVWGPAGSRKSMGYIETIASKFEGDEKNE